MKNILIPSDFSKTANQARDYAIKLAELFNSEIIMLNAYYVPYTGSGSGTFVNIDHIAKEAAENEMKKQKEYFQLNHPNLSVKYLCSYGLLLDLVKKVCKKKEIDLVVMGTTGATGFIGNLLGSNTEALIGSIKTPIIAIPDGVNINPPKNIVVGNDLMMSGKNILFNMLKEFSKKNNSKIDFLFIVKEEEEIIRREQQLKAVNFDNAFDTSYHPFHFKNNEDVEDGILDFITNNDVDLFVTVSHQRNFLKNLFHKSVTKALVKHIKIPILILHE